ncbi:MAG: DUF1489 family protein, partial [Dongiaceae bacterium]
MTLHLIKLSVGSESVEELRQWQEEILARKRRQRQKPELFHWTRMMPKRKAEILAGGSIYWIIKGFVRARQCVIDLDRRTDEDGKAYCAIVLDPPLIPTELRSHRAFQGWRYLDPADAPPDVAKRGLSEARAGWGNDPPPEMLKQLK